MKDKISARERESFEQALKYNRSHPEEMFRKERETSGSDILKEKE